MSWSIDVTGTKSAVTKTVTEQLDKIVASYEGVGQSLTLAKAKLSALAGSADPKAVAAQTQEVANLNAKLLEGNEETKDVAIAKERILAIVAAVDLEPDPESPAWNAIRVRANGTHNLSEKGIVDARMGISVVRTHLAFD